MREKVNQVQYYLPTNKIPQQDRFEFAYLGIIVRGEIVCWEPEYAFLLGKYERGSYGDVVSEYFGWGYLSSSEKNRCSRSLKVEAINFLCSASVFSIINNS